MIFFLPISIKIFLISFFKYGKANISHFSNIPNKATQSGELKFFQDIQTMIVKTSPLP